MKTQSNDGGLLRHDVKEVRDNASLNKDALASGIEADAPLPRPKRKRRKAKSDRGLPPDKELRKLAVAYLECQRKHWPQLVEAGLLPEPTETNVNEMVEDFKQRHRTGKVSSEAVQAYLKIVRFMAGLYARFSTENNNPASALDQMVNCLKKAHSEGRFVPWFYVFCDYAVTGLDSTRQGYSSFKSIFKDRSCQLDTIYIDDFTRASRDEIEWWTLASETKQYDVRLIGASDGFDLSDANSDLLITMFGLVSRLFIKGTREKVKRGMKGAASRGDCVGKLPLGFTKKVRRDEHGNILYRSDGTPKMEPCIDPETSKYRLLIFELYVNKGWSAYKIAKHFNRIKVDGWDGWTDKTIKNLIWSATSQGLFVWNKTRREYDPMQGKVVKIKNPPSEWERYFDPELAIVPRDLWRAARRKLKKIRDDNPLTGRPQTRNQIFASTLFSGTLMCGHCLDNGIKNAELKLTRSTEKYKQLGCFDGLYGKHGCKLKSSKSTRIIEDALLPYLRDIILSEENLTKIVDRANAYLKEEAAKPQVDVAPMKKEERKLKSKIDKLFRQIENEPDQAISDMYHQRIREHHKERELISGQIHKAVLLNRKRNVRPLDAEHVKSYLADLRGLLNDEVPVAAEAIRALTGLITVRQEENSSQQRGGRWIATFRPDFLRFLLWFAQGRNIEESVFLELADLPEPEEVEVIVGQVPQYVKRAPEFKKLHDKGASILSIANAYDVSWQFVKDTLKYAETGEKPKWKPGTKKRNGSNPKRKKYEAISPQVADLRDNRQMSFARIAKELDVGEGTVRRAYDHAHPEVVRQAVEQGTTTQRGKYSYLGLDVKKRIRELLLEGMKVSEIAVEVGCGESTVYRVQRKMREEGERLPSRRI